MACCVAMETALLLHIYWSVCQIIARYFHACWPRKVQSRMALKQWLVRKYITHLCEKVTQVENVTEDIRARIGKRLQIQYHLKDSRF